jgi:hypothetical protein
MENPRYTFRYKFLLSPKWKEAVVIGHNFHKEANRMDLYLPNGGIISIPLWGFYEMRLGSDWVAASKKSMENEAGGQRVNLNVAQERAN